MSNTPPRLPPQTTGHTWDGNIQEFNNPIPRWWLWGVYVAVALALLYWWLAPAWSVEGGGGSDATSVPASTVPSIRPVGVTADAVARMGPRALFRKPTLEALALSDYLATARVPRLMAATRSAVRQLYADNCAACHGAGGAGVLGAFPSLTDSDWLWGGGFRDLEVSIAEGRRGFMPGFGAVFDADELDDLAGYVLSLSGLDGEPGGADGERRAAVERRRRGEALFVSTRGGCAICHGDAGQGDTGLGASNLGDAIWLRVDVPGAETAMRRRAVVADLVRRGVPHSVMPGWRDRLSADEIKLLAIYVHELGRG